MTVKGGHNMHIRRTASTLALVVVLGCAASLLSQTVEYLEGVCTGLDQAFGSVQTDLTRADLDRINAEVGDMVEVIVPGHVLEIPVVEDMFPDLPQSLPGLIVWGDSVFVVGWYSNVAAEYGIDVGTRITVRLLQKGGYLDDIEEREVVRIEHRYQCASDEEYANFRMVTYGTIAPGVLFRSSHPADGSDRSSFAHSLMEEAAVRTVINVGSSWNDPQLAYDNSKYYRACGDAGDVLATNIGLAITWSHFKTELRSVLSFIIDHEPPYLIHCRIGQDRTGIAIAVLEALSGATLDEVVSDYAATFENYYLITPDHALHSEVVEQILSKLREMNYGLDVTSENLQTAIERYLVSEVGLSEMELLLLRERLSQDLSYQDVGPAMLALAAVSGDPM